MPLRTRQKVLIAIIVVLSIIAIAEIALLIKLKVEHEKMYIPFLHKIGLIPNGQQNSALDSNFINFVKTDNNKKVSIVTPVKITVQPSIVASKNSPLNVPTRSNTDISLQKTTVITPQSNITNLSAAPYKTTDSINTAAIPNNSASVVTPQNNNTAQNNNSSTLTDADKQYIQSLIASNLAPINDKLKQNDIAITAANNNATQALATINTAQKNINNRLAKNESEISIANNNATQALATANSVQKNINDRLARDENAIASASVNTNKTLATLSSTVAATTDRLAKDETPINEANANATKLLSEISGNNKITGPLGQGSQTSNSGSTTDTAITMQVPAIPPESNQPATLTSNKESSASTTARNQPVQIAAQNKSVTAQPTAAQSSIANASDSPNTENQTSNFKSVTVIATSHKRHHIIQLPGVYIRVMRADPSSYTIQLIADSGLKSLYEYMWAYCLGYSATPLHTRHLGQNWYVLIYGQFNTVYQANAALQQFPNAALRWRPFVRRMSDVQRMITDPRGEDALVGQSHQNVC